MRFTLASLFPEFFDSPLSAGLMAKARDSGLVQFDFVNPREFTEDAHRTVDDKPYGGGPGMVMMAGPLKKALDSVKRPGRMILLSPKGRPLDQELARELSQEESLTLVCGRYEGIDARLEEIFPLESVSVGDFVLNGGEAGALCLIEAVARLLPGFMGHAASGSEESFSSGTLEYPHYTRPETFEDKPVPEVLLSGDHARIAAWRRQKGLEQTLALRPDMLPEAPLNAEEGRHLGSISRKRLGRNLYLCLVHYPVLDKSQNPCAVSLTNLDIHDMCRVSRSYGLGGLFLATPLEDQRELARTLIGHWTEGAGAQSNPDRAEALGLARVVETIEEAAEKVADKAGQRPRILATSAARFGETTPAVVRGFLGQEPVLLLLGTAHGLAPQALDLADGCLRPLRWLDGYNHLAVRSAASVYVDRILADEF